MVDRIDPIEEANRKKRAQMTDSAREAMMQAAMNKNPSMNQAANNDMANVSQGTSAVSDVSRLESVNAQNNQIAFTGDTTKIAEEKNMGLSTGTRIEKPDGTDRTPKTEKLLVNSTDTMGLYNQIDLINKKKKEA